MASRGEHNFDGPLKQAWRDRNLEFLIQYGQKIWAQKPRSFRSDGELHPTVVELLGESGFLSFEMLKPFLTDPNTQYYGLEADPSVIAKVLQQPHDFRVRYGDIGRHLQYTEDPVSVILWDDMAGAGTLTWWGRNGHERRLEQALTRHCRTYGEVALIFNMSLRTRKTTNAERVLNLNVMRQKLARIFNVDPDLVIKDLSVAGEQSPAGQHDSMDFYRSRMTPMVTFRAIYASNGHHRLQGMDP